MLGVRTRKLSVVCAIPALPMREGPLAITKLSKSWAIADTRADSLVTAGFVARTFRAIARCGAAADVEHRR